MAAAIISKGAYKSLVDFLCGQCLPFTTTDNGFVGIQSEGVCIYRSSKVTGNDAVFTDGALPGWMGGACGPAENVVPGGIEHLAVSLGEQSPVRRFLLGLLDAAAIEEAPDAKTVACGPATVGEAACCEQGDRDAR